MCVCHIKQFRRKSLCYNIPQQSYAWAKIEVDVCELKGHNLPVVYNISNFIEVKNICAHSYYTRSKQSSYMPIFKIWSTRSCGRGQWLSAEF